MTILLDKDNKYLSMSSGGFPDKTLNTREYDGEIPEVNEEAGERLEWDEKSQKVVKI